MATDLTNTGVLLDDELPEPETPAARSHHLSTISKLVLRWVFLIAVTLIAFHRSVASLIHSTIEGGLIGFVWLMPVVALVTVGSLTRRARVELPIHDRQTDIIVGILGLGFALMLQCILLQRYSEYFDLLRIDLLAMWLFLAASSTVLFGLRPVTRFGWVWILLLPIMFPLGYQLSVIFYGGNRPSAGMASLVIGAAATAVSVGRTPSRAMIGAAWAMLVGAIVLAAMSVFTPNAPLLAFQMIPAMLAMSSVGLGLFGYARRGRPKRFLDRRIEPLVSRQVWAGIPLVLIAATVIFLTKLPSSTAAPTVVEGLSFGQPLAAPAGWHQTAEADYGWVRRLYGREARQFRQEFLADVGNPAWDKKARPRTVIVDATSTERPFSLQVYPAKLLYNDSASRISDPKLLDLGHGITGALTTVVDDKALLTFNQLTWTWANGDGAQRVTVASVDDHEDDAEFLEPVGGLGATLQTMFNVFFRGNQATWDSDPTFKDEAMLTEFGKGLVEAQLGKAAA